MEIVISFTALLNTGSGLHVTMILSLVPGAISE